jgi:signal transduction histidine kinase
VVAFNLQPVAEYRPPIEDELVGRSAWLIRLRWVAGAAVLAGTLAAWGFLGPGVPVAWLVAAGVGILLYNTVFLLLLRRLSRLPDGPPARYSRFASAQFITDWIALTVLAHLTGGIGSPILAYFVFHGIIASILLPPRAAWLHATAGVLLVALLGASEYFGLLPHRPIPGFDDIRHENLPQIMLLFMAFASAIFVSIYLASSIARRLWSRTGELLRVKQSLEIAYHRTRTLYEIAGAVNSTLDLTEVLDTIGRSAVEALGGKACSIRLLDEETGRLQLASTIGLSEQYLAKGSVDPQKSPMDREVLRGRAISVADVFAEGVLQYPEEARREGIRSVLCVPLRVRRQVIGVLRVYGGDERVFSPEDTGFLTALASQGAVAIANARAYGHLEELEEVKSRFVFMVAHELKAPVAAVGSSLDILKDGYAGTLTERQEHLVNRATRRMAALQTLLQDLLALGAMKGRVPDVKLAPVNLTDVLRRVTDRVAAEADRKRIELEIDTPEAPVLLKATEDDMDRLLGNLLENAVKYTPDAGKVRFALARTSGEVRIVCQDTGIGIAEDALPHVFEEFYRARNAKQMTEGTGLGLALAKRIVDLHRGEISVESEVGKGTTFTVVFPSE